MRIIGTVFALLFVVGCATGEPGSGKSKQEVRTLAPFTSIELGGALDTKIAVGKFAQSVEITGDDNLLPLVTTEVKNGRLEVRTTRSIRPKIDMVLTIKVPSLTAVSLSGAGNATIDGVQSDAFTIKLSGAANLVAKGTARRLEVEVSGAGNVDARDLKTEAAVVSVSGAGDVDVSAQSSLDVSISGSGTVSYDGEPADLKQHISGSGSLKKR